MNRPFIAPGDVVHAATDLRNDGSHPKFQPDEVVVPAGTRGVVVRIGHAEADDRVGLFLVRFEQPDGILGPPIGCWAAELLPLQEAVPVALS